MFVFANDNESVDTQQDLLNNYNEEGFNWFFLILLVSVIAFVFILIFVLLPNGSGYRKKVIYDDFPDTKKLKEYEKEILKNPEISTYWREERNKLAAKDAIRAYILDNKSEFTKFQIKEALVRDGFPLDVIEEVYAEVYG